MATYFAVLKGDACFWKNACGSSGTACQMAASAVHDRSMIISHFMFSFLLIKDGKK